MAYKTPKNQAEYVNYILSANKSNGHRNIVPNRMGAITTETQPCHPFLPIKTANFTI